LTSDNSISASAKQNSIDFDGKRDTCLVRENLSSSVAAIKTPSLKMHAEESECKKFKPKT
jgi:hypothetical protein